MSLSLSVAEARRIMLAAQGFAQPRPQTPNESDVDAVIDRIGLFQIDSVQVLQRAHYMPIYARLGGYDTEWLHRAAHEPPRKLIEYWAHEAALVDVRFFPALGFRMADLAGMRQRPRQLADREPRFLTEVFGAVQSLGAMSAREVRAAFDTGIGSAEPYRGATRDALEYFFYIGQLSSAKRNAAFERRYDVIERIIPEPYRSAAPLDVEAAHQTLVLHAARALGIATAAWLADYFRLKITPVRQAIAALEDAGHLQAVDVGGWRQPAWLAVGAQLPTQIDAATLVSPFDPLVFERSRTEALFDFHYRIEIYVPEAQRQHGYYVLPFLLGDQLVARVDLKADRPVGRLLVQATWSEPHTPAHTAFELAAELWRLAKWLDLSSIAVAPRGNLAADLQDALEKTGK